MCYCVERERVDAPRRDIEQQDGGGVVEKEDKEEVNESESVLGTRLRRVCVCVWFFVAEYVVRLPTFRMQRKTAQGI